MRFWVLIGFFIASAASASETSVMALQELVAKGENASPELIQYVLSSDDVRHRMIANEILFTQSYGALPIEVRRELLLTNLFHQRLLLTLAGVKPVSAGALYVDPSYKSLLLNDLRVLAAILYRHGVDVAKVIEGNSENADFAIHMMIVNPYAVGAVARDHERRGVLHESETLTKLSPVHWVGLMAKHFPLSDTPDLRRLSGILYGYPIDDVRTFADDGYNPFRVRFFAEHKIVPQFLLPDGREQSLFDFRFATFEGTRPEQLQKLREATYEVGYTYLRGVRRGLAASEILHQWRTLACESAL